MVQLREDTQNKTRDLPISTALKTLLLSAGKAAGLDLVRVTSGGQCRKGTCTKRTGSTRHDDGQAADLQLIVGGRTLNFTKSSDLPTFEAFVTAAARAGATGIGAGLDYMGADTIHIGFGGRAVWGAGGKSANAPAWIRAAAKRGWGGGSLMASMRSTASEFEGVDETDVLDSDDEEVEEADE